MYLLLEEREVVFAVVFRFLEAEGCGGSASVESTVGVGAGAGAADTAGGARSGEESRLVLELSELELLDDSRELKLMF